MARGVMGLWIWNEWATQILVLLSLALQVVLLLSADIRRREHSVLRPVLWLAYLLADYTAIYAVNHLSLSSIPREHQLVAFWAPFLLLHLGGPDNITAYALEDNELWKRHFITLVAQVLGAGYILYKHIAGSGSLVVLAAVLMLVVGVLKYGERTWALWLANFSSIQSSLKVPPRSKHHQHFYTEHQGYLRGAQDVDEEFLLQRAHSLFRICKRGIVGSLINPEEVVSEDKLDIKIIWGLMKDREGMWTVMEMELSLMYDILYTKANVIHSCFVGYCIRVVSPLAIVASLLLFQFSGKEGQSGVDVAITYVLLGGAFVLETISLLSALGSSWAFPFLCATRWSWLRHAALCTGRWHRLRRALLPLRRLAKITTGSSRRRSRTMEQYSMLHFTIGQLDPTRRRLGKFAKMLGFSEWWDRWYDSWTVDIPEVVKKRTQRLDLLVLLKDLNTMGLVRYKWGALAMKKHPELEESLKEWIGVDFHETIISWHIATDLFLARRKRSGAHDAVQRVEAIRALSNYMMFLLVKRPYMLPGLHQNWLYQKTCDNLDEICQKNREKLLNSQGRTNVCAVLKKLFRFSRLEQTKDVLAGFVLDHQRKTDYNLPRLNYARKIANILLGMEDMKTDAVDVLLDMWTDFLVYAANRCSGKSHAKGLESGGEFTTVVRLMIVHLYQIKEGTKQGQGNV